MIEQKLTESMWWVFVLADKLDIDIDDAFTNTMTKLKTDLEATIARTVPEAE